MKVLGPIFLLLLSCSMVFAQNQPTETIDGIVKEVLRIISGEENKVRDWDYFRSLFLPTAHFTIVNHSEEIPAAAETVSLEEFIALMDDEYYKKGFVEYEIGKVVNEYNGIANAFQSFYAKDSENMEGRGVTSYNLVFVENRWWISNLIWTTETTDMPIPDTYLNKKID